jgi:Putative zinc-finger
MPGETKHGIECTEFEALLSDAIDGDGQLTPARKQRFEAHRRVCAVCGPLFADVQAGQQYLRSLETVEPPPHLVHNILAATTGVVSRRPQASAVAGGRTTPFGERLREWWDSLFTPVAALVRQPRFAMSFGMIFFSSSLILNLAGVKPSDMAKVDLRPSAVRHVYNDAQIKVVKYYDNIRFVYEIESKLRELKRANTPAGPGPKEQKDNRKNNTSGQPDQKQDRNYSQEYNQPVLAALRDASPEATVTTNRRFV